MSNNPMPLDDAELAEYTGNAACYEGCAGIWDNDQVKRLLATISRDRQKARVGEDVRDGVVAAMRKALDEPKGPTDEMVADAALRHLHSIGYVMRPGRDALVDLFNRLVDGNGHSWPSTYIIADALLSAMEGEKGA